jgi:hypothetical protein
MERKKTTQYKEVPPSAEETLNENLSARPGAVPEFPGNAESEMKGSDVEFGEMNLEDAKESGYTDEEGNAISLAKKDRQGSPTGAFTDIGAGRSSAVRSRDSRAPGQR